MPKRPTVTAIATLAALLLPSAVLAEDLSYSGGVTVTSNYLSDGLSETDNGPALQPWFEVTKNGFYAGAWATNLKDEDGNRAELDLSFGYRGETAGHIEYDLGYTQYLYDKVHAGSSELAISLGVPVTDQLTLTGEVDYDLPDRTFGEIVGAEFAIDDTWTLHGEVGKTDPDASVNYNAGVTYALSDQTGIDLQVQDTASTSARVALSLTYAFGGGAD